MKKARLTLKIVLTSVISLLLVTSIMLSTILGSVSAKLYKTLSKSLDFEVVPDLAFSYYLKDNLNSSGITGSYKNTASISQGIQTFSSTVNTLYRIAIPVDESGYYTLKFTVNILRGDASEYYIRNLDAPVGCQVLSPAHFILEENVTDLRAAALTSNLIYSMSPDDVTDNGYAYGTRISYDDKNVFDAKDHYQWKTLAPYRTETVELSYSVEQSDVDNFGFVIWTWDFTGLNATKNYTLNLTDISIEKNNPIDSSKPYFEFMNTQYVNNAILPTEDDTKKASPYSGEGVATSGLTRHNRARGTFVTNGTYDSLTMQASPLYMGYNSSKKFLTANITDVQSQKSNYENVISFSAPIKNIKPNTNYRVSFDFSVANQGTGTASYEDIVDIDTNTTPAGSAAYANYQSGYRNFFNNNEAWHTLHFQSYIGNGATSGTSISAHTTGRGTVRLANVGFPGHEVTRYDEIFYVGGGATDTVAGKTYEISDSKYTSASVTERGSHAAALNSGITDKAGDEFNSGKGINWLNAIKHTEEEGDYLIHWLTFYNTSFTFNVDHDYANKEVNVVNGYCQDLFWTWAIDALEQAKYFRIKIENVRIEEVEQYGSCLTEKSLKIGGEKNARTDFFAGKDFATTNVDNISVKNTYRGSNGTGQNYQARGYINEDSLPRLAGNNVFGAIYDAGDIDINGNYEIKFNGYCAVKGGVEKYVWSADGGATWYDMEADTLRAPSSTSYGEQERISVHCENLVDQRFNNTTKLSFLGETRYSEIGDPPDTDGTYNRYAIPGVTDTATGISQPFDFIDFVRGTDDINSVFVGLTADLSEYKYQRDLDIVFAAVPIQNPTARCEILRIINFNSSKQYRTYTLEFESDFEVTYTNTKLNATYNTSDSESNVVFTERIGVKYSKSGSTVTKSFAKAGGYSWRTDASSAYEDVRVLYSNMPVKNTLTVRGWAIVEGGVEAYMWSVDKGKTWQTCKQRGASSGSTGDLSSQYTAWYSPDGNGSLDSTLTARAYFDTAENGLSIDLTDYVGKVVDLIVAAKPNGSDALCPVSRIDNVAVYGTGERDNGMGLFYSKITKVLIDNVQVSQVQNYPAEAGSTTLSGMDQWNLGLQYDAFTVYEPYNLELSHMRLYNAEYNSISNGGTLKISGYIACRGGVAKYKYSLDGGEWTEFSGRTINEQDAVTNMVKKTTDASFTAADAADYRTNTLNIKLPTSVSGERDLLVVAEGNNGYLYPVLHIRLNIAAAN